MDGRGLLVHLRRAGTSKDRNSTFDPKKHGPGLWEDDGDAWWEGSVIPENWDQSRVVEDDEDVEVESVCLKTCNSKQ